MIDIRLLEDVKEAEGCRLVAYKDSLGYWTIGYGHFLDQSVDWTDHEITQETADSLLSQDLGQAQSEAKGLPEWPALDTDCRQNAVTELVFNMGLSKWKGFVNTRRSIEQSDWHGAYSGLLDSLWASQVGKARSTRLANYLLAGVYT